ncbi:hypothetical protein SERLADRAFT_434300 [Serpula lacrymans var. lacrymans S7.9]|uniref:Uncharacterized protein n=1 Tax=Serpula lacrymans var. lacrymans (strain S7.9) TaxID=578457 RepID=F8NKC2_SERL9|nr:uncharacterized protein SERLADRAFT_434300 [Serpula lacrymans var. lacrymans S7.9]EGO28388.1 hypothetical protein SERLADRAFT_434300 [Serpula lacrymans var. lacrymans S7.9]
MPNSEDSLDEANIQAIYPPYPLPLSVAQATQIEGKDEHGWEVEGGLTTEKRKLDDELEDLASKILNK